ncbi:hypothetical protein HOF92_03555 [bacterium]|jgi:hypothetical protein|nr:hypothetical protein [bacterium]
MSSRRLPSFVKEEHPPPWQDAMALICTKCFERLPLPLRTDELANLRKWLKTRLKQDGHWDKLRVLTSGCQAFCPEEGISIYLQKNRNPRRETVWILRSDVNREQLYLELLEALLS